MSSQSIISVCNISLLSIGAQAQISNLQEGSTQSDACNTYFQFVFEMLARAAYWNCLRQQKTLSLLAAAAGTPENPNGTTLPLPPTPWLYSYAIPSDSLQARYIVPMIPNASGSNTPLTTASVTAGAWLPTQQVPFRVAYSADANNNPIPIILTNQSQAQLVYTVNQNNPRIWDSSFTAAMVASLAAWLVPALSLNMPLMKAQAAIATELVMSARVRDGDEGTTSQDNIPDWIKARNAGGGYGWGGGYSATNYGALSWPAG